MTKPASFTYSARKWELLGMSASNSTLLHLTLGDHVHEFDAAQQGFVAVRIDGRTRSICEVLLILRDCRIDPRRRDGFRERTSSVLSRSCA